MGTSGSGKYKRDTAHGGPFLRAFSFSENEVSVKNLPAEMNVVPDIKRPLTVFFTFRGFFSFNPDKLSLTDIFSLWKL